MNSELTSADFWSEIRRRIGDDDLMVTRLRNRGPVRNVVMDGERLIVGSNDVSFWNLCSGSRQPAARFARNLKSMHVYKHDGSLVTAGDDLVRWSLKDGGKFIEAMSCPRSRFLAAWYRNFTIHGTCKRHHKSMRFPFSDVHQNMNTDWMQPVFAPSLCVFLADSCMCLLICLSSIVAPYIYDKFEFDISIFHYSLAVSISPLKIGTGLGTALMVLLHVFHIYANYIRLKAARQISGSPFAYVIILSSVASSSIIGLGLAGPLILIPLCDVATTSALTFFACGASEELKVGPLLVFLLYAPYTALSVPTLTDTEWMSDLLGPSILVTSILVTSILVMILGLCFSMPIMLSLLCLFGLYSGYFCYLYESFVSFDVTLRSFCVTYVLVICSATVAHLFSTLDEKYRRCVDFLVIGSTTNNRVELFCPNSGRIVSTFDAHGDKINAAVATCDGTRLFTASNDRTAIAWDIQSATPIIVFTGHAGRVKSVDVASGDKYLLTGSSDCTAIVWDVTSGDEISKLIGHAGSVNAARFVNGKRRAITASSDGTTILWRIPDGTRIRTFYGHASKVNCICISPNAKYFATGSEDSTAIVWDMRFPTVVRRRFALAMAFNRIHADATRQRCRRQPISNGCRPVRETIRRIVNADHLVPHILSYTGGPPKDAVTYHAMKLEREWGLIREESRVRVVRTRHVTGLQATFRKFDINRKQFCVDCDVHSSSGRRTLAESIQHLPPAKDRMTLIKSVRKTAELSAAGAKKRRAQIRRMEFEKFARENARKSARATHIDRQFKERSRHFKASNAKQERRREFAASARKRDEDIHAQLRRIHIRTLAIGNMSRARRDEMIKKFWEVEDEKQKRRDSR